MTTICCQREMISQRRIERRLAFLSYIYFASWADASIYLLCLLFHTTRAADISRLAPRESFGAFGRRWGASAYCLYIMWLSLEAFIWLGCRAFEGQAGLMMRCLISAAMHMRTLPSRIYCATLYWFFDEDFGHIRWLQLIYDADFMPLICNFSPAHLLRSLRPPQHYDNFSHSLPHRRFRRAVYLRVGLRFRR